MSKRTLVIGWDGAPYDKISKWVQEGKLKNLGKLVDKGAFGPLETTKLTISSCAWTTMVTGKNAGKHGIYDFFGTKFVSDSYFREPINSKWRRAKALWNYLSNYGYRVGTVNIPITYPAERVNGFMVGGMMSPGVDAPGFTYPANLLKDYPKLKEYRIDIEGAKHLDRDKFIYEVNKTIEERFNLFRYLIIKEDVDLFFGVFTSSDRFSHYMWHFFDQNHPYRKHESEEDLKKYKNSLLELYQKLDEYLGELISEFGPDNVMVVSDHGFASIYKYFEFNKWLYLKGYLKFKPKSEWKEFKHGKLNPKRTYIYGKVDWSETQAYMIGKRGSVYINLEGREPHGVVKKEEYEDLVEELIKEIKKIKDPETGEYIVQDALPRDEIFSGPYLNEAPDILTFFKDKYASIGYIVDLNSEDLFIVNDRPDLELELGIERYAGIFVASGLDYRHTNVNAWIGDVTPTILHTYGIPRDPDMDGKVLDIFAEDFVFKERKAELSKKEKSIIAKLKKLGKI
ncbi:Type I phosphodiesterase / nucleotide pyrophosphatase superfamily [Aciduliprofundum boonei T469]|nr:Type I phosphodiesterase / nucleotide pyrophosphatase superfamily [Aciduliprofundum boonei T469]